MQNPNRFNQLLAEAKQKIEGASFDELTDLSLQLQKMASVVFCYEGMNSDNYTRVNVISSQCLTAMENKL